MRSYLFYLIILSSLLALTSATDKVVPLKLASKTQADLTENFAIKNKSKNSSTIKLTIFPDTTIGTNLDNGKKIVLRRARVLTPWGSHSLAEPAQLEGELPNNFELNIVNSNGSTKRLNLPKPLSERLRQYLLFGAPSKPFDCSSFVHHMLGVPHDFAAFDSQNWTVHEFVQEPSYPGAVVAIGLSSYFDPKKITHFGLYLGDGLYISKFGVMGSLVISTLSEMKKVFGGSYVFNLTPAAYDNHLELPPNLNRPRQQSLARSG